MPVTTTGSSALFDRLASIGSTTFTVQVPLPVLRFDEPVAVGVVGAPVGVLLHRQQRELDGGVGVELGLADIGRRDDEAVFDALTDQRAHAQQGDDHRAAEHGDVNSAGATPIADCNLRLRVAAMHRVISRRYRCGRRIWSASTWFWYSIVTWIRLTP